MRLNPPDSGALRPRPLRLLTSLALLLTAGCTSGQIGGEVVIEDGTGLEGAGCTITGSQPIGDDEPTSLGFSAAQALELLRGDFEASLAWMLEAPESGDVPLVTPASGVSAVQLTIDPRPGSVRLLELELGSSGGAEGGLGFAPAGTCADLVAIDASVQITSDNGAFDDTFDVTFAVESAHFARATIPLAPGELMGSFDAEPPESRPGARVIQVHLDLGLTPGMASGKISGGLEENDGQAASFGGVEFGHFPAETVCLTGAPLAPESELAQAAQQAIAELQTFQVAWTDGTTSQLELESTGGDACLDTLGGETRVHLQVESRAQSDDGSIDGTWHLEGLVTLDAAGDLQRAELLRQAYLSETFDPGRFAEATGIHKFPVDDGLRSTFSFSVEREFADAAPASGALSVMEVTPADCESQEPIELEGGGAAAPGCAGDQVSEIGGATLTAAP